MDVSSWTTVGKAEEWPAEGGRMITLGPRRIGVYHHQGAWYALKDICPHAGVSLAKGPVADGAVMCVGHGWRFSLTNGAIVSGPKGFKVPAYPARERDGVIEVDFG